ncbi:MAG: sulfatase-like hydrolase/transferase [Fuerstiella sp.]|nr:sulfatase-like hydrolase/transferase [Fuerstiella sp.]MCP4855713.1 sulfatase-like hydrolase/transferase [Fuerstiella sp.]
MKNNTENENSITSHSLRCFGLIVGFLGVSALANASADERPNIIVFVTDDQVKDELACYGGKVLTPNVDRLAREGILFDNAHVPSTVCTPSRYTLLTGRFPGNSYSSRYLAEHPRDRQGNPGFNLGPENDNMNIGNVLREAGYVTGLVGKLHVGPELKKREDYEAVGLYYPDDDADPDSPETIAGWQRNERWYREWQRQRFLLGQTQLLGKHQGAIQPTQW